MIDGQAALFVLDEIDSTNLESVRRIEAGESLPIWLLARSQTGGRGRRGRVWVSERGNLFLSYAATTMRQPGEIALLGFAAALAVADLVEAVTGKTPALKWPNDVLLDGSKVSGILLESGSRRTRGNWFVLGIGVNLVSAPVLADRATASISDHLQEAPAPETAMAILRPRLAFWAQTLAHEGFGPLQAAWLARAHGLGRQVNAEIGAERLTGIVRGLDLNGALLLEIAPGQVRPIAAGEIFFSDPNPC